MKLFGKKQLDTKGKKAAEEEAEEEEAPAAAAQKPSIPTERFSARMGGVFGRMYKLIFSVSLQQNVYQVESGVPEINGEAIAVRGYYDAVYQALLNLVKEGEKERFTSEFSRASLYELLKNGRSGISDVFSMSGLDDKEKTEDEVYYLPFEFRADRIPDESNQSQRVILYLRNVNDGVDIGARREKQTEKDPVQNARVRKLLGSSQTVFFEYQVKEDILTLHRTGHGEGDYVGKNYLAMLSIQSDMRVSHDDISVLSKAFKDAAAGKTTTAEIRYRAGGDRKAPFHLHRLTVAPLEDSGEVTTVIGGLVDIDEQTEKKGPVFAFENEVENIVYSMYTRVYLLDTAHNLMTKLSYSEKEGLHPVDKPEVLSVYVQSRATDASVAEVSRPLYAAWLQKGYLERKTLKGPFSYEVSLKQPGDLSYRWYSETISRIDKKGNYLCLRRDIDDVHKNREESFASEENLRHAEHNRYMLEFLAGLVEFRNLESGAHIAHVCKLTEILMKDIANRSPQYKITNKMISLYVEAATMHDVGKITIPDNILNKNGLYTPDEMAVMKTHTTAGYNIIQNMKMPGQQDLKDACCDVALHHHERYDGHGYPEGLEGDAISIGVQAIGLADAYDALVSERCYKKPYPHDKALQMLLNGECGVFNPRLIESLKICQPEMQRQYETPDEDVVEAEAVLENADAAAEEKAEETKE